MNCASHAPLLTCVAEAHALWKSTAQTLTEQKYLAFPRVHNHSGTPSPTKCQFSLKKKKERERERPVITQIILSLSVPFLWTLHFLSFFFHIFKWWKIVLQSYIGFCHTTTQISHNFIYPFPLELPTPLHHHRMARLGSVCYLATSH